MGKFEGKGKGKRGSKFAQAAAKSTPQDSRGDEFDPGKYRVTFTSCTESDNGSYGITLQGAGKDKKIGERLQWFSTGGKAVHVSGPRLKRLAMILAGIDDSDEYLDFDPNGVFLGAILENDLDAAAEHMVEAGKAKSASKALAALTSTEFSIRVTKGGDKDDGGFFRNAEFSPIGEDAGDEEDEDEAPESEPASERKPKAGKRKPSRDEEEEEEEEDEDDSDDEEDDSDDEEEPESERKPAKKKARRK
jgi:hypothetical protein